MVYYLYSEQELRPWVDKVKQIAEQTKTLHIYFNNHYSGKAVVNAMQFKEMNDISLSREERKVLEHAQERIAAKIAGNDVELSLHHI